MHWLQLDASTIEMKASIKKQNNPFFHLYFGLLSFSLLSQHHEKSPLLGGPILPIASIMGSGQKINEIAKKTER